jgi:branched-chain amino acid transport system permease protein
LLGVADAIWPPVTTRQLPSLFAGHQVSIFGVVVTYYQLMVLAVSVAVAGLLRLLFTKTRVGMTMRAVVDDRDLAAMAGASPFRTAQLSWALGASLAALAGILIAPLEYLDQFNLTLLVINGYAAAVVGGLRSLPLTVVGAMLLGLLDAYAVGYLPTKLLSDLQPVIPMALLFAVLLILRPGRLQGGRIVGGATPRIPSLLASVVAALAFFVLAVFVSGRLSAANLLTAGQGIVFGVIMLSLVLLTGFSGQVSLCQMTFAGFGAFFMGKTLGGGSILGLVAATAIPAAIGAVLAMAVLRLRGLYLALATLAFAYAMDSLFFNHFLGFGGILHVGRVHPPGLPTTQRGYFLLITAVFAAVAVGVLALRRGSFGRQLAAMSDSEAACASLGLNITGLKILAFTLAAAIAGLGGAFYGGWQHDVGPNDFQMLTSLILLLLIALGGINTVSGAFAAATFYALSPIIQKHVGISDFTLLLPGLGAAFLGQNPGGFVGQLSSLRRAFQGRSGAWTTGPPPTADYSSVGPQAPPLAIAAGGNGEGRAAGAAGATVAVATRPPRRSPNGRAAVKGGARARG